MCPAEFHTELLLDLSGQLWGTHLLILLLAGVQPFPQRRMCFVGMPVPLIA